MYIATETSTREMTGGDHLCCWQHQGVTPTFAEYFSMQGQTYSRWTMRATPHIPLRPVLDIVIPRPCYRTVHITVRWNQSGHHASRNSLLPVGKTLTRRASILPPGKNTRNRLLHCQTKSVWNLQGLSNVTFQPISRWILTRIGPMLKSIFPRLTLAARDLG